MIHTLQSTPQGDFSKRCSLSLPEYFLLMFWSLEFPLTFSVVAGYEFVIEIKKILTMFFSPTVLCCFTLQLAQFQTKFEFEFNNP